MLFDDTYKTIAQSAEGLFKDKGSKFIAYAYPVSSDEQVKTILQQLRAEHPKARHHCWALRLTPDKSVFRLQDDGEPSGTGGRPILNAILSADLTNILIVVVRYFGGTLLGVPGLINAYRTAAADAISVAQVIEKTVNDIYEITFDYLVMNDVMKLIKDQQLNVIFQSFDSTSTMRFEVRKSQVNVVADRLSNIQGLEAKYLYTG
ncbi:IMPACT family protein [Pedobacter deserti]|uniref:IMPACT family protein n=1 Tax=Pedobacter deserti TaxID=2817382 RepID=UPI00210E3D16|nr:YigZ family protein [Pedobacter sp. SYSU D00382]